MEESFLFVLLAEFYLHAAISGVLLQYIINNSINWHLLVFFFQLVLLSITVTSNGLSLTKIN